MNFMLGQAKASIPVNFVSCHGTSEKIYTNQTCFVIVDWEGPEAIEECSDAEANVVRGATPTTPLEEEEMNEDDEANIESESDGAEDEYVANEEDKPKGKVKVCKWIFHALHHPNHFVYLFRNAPAVYLSVQN